ncbi:ferritin-like domain-containing protein [Gordonia sp. (in: high G+C Gram-positive bacteria)]|uniref:ferritin-like domain-containing protein n=1 Tax=Gordonia sp. (in: high G+C Gram-positive bacteria) TaxID=84139 RepID=UPI0016B79A03|nr:ferritin-like domain-containing protein [Gordonia sp. (in: high G+C Gram-positive bacteria)]NLG46315.1 ferritin-like domain-containing protein [Gordonia sp. (in: high G+C Gram-positive bacteria)]
MSYDFDAMLQTIKDKQWSLADIDWDAPGAETMSDETRARMAPFMADLVWIEHIGARGFAALAKQAPTPTIREIYRYFHAEEQKHANAELALMKRWGMLPDGRIPEPTIQVKMAITVLDSWGDDLPLAGLAALIPLLEVALDGALVKFLTDEVDDPLCHEVFRHINNDEARHIATDFQVLELIGVGSTVDHAVKAVALLDPRVAVGLTVVFVPLISKMRNNVVAMGLEERKLMSAIKRYSKIGGRGPNTRKLVSYHILRAMGEMIVDRSHPYHRLLGDPMVIITDRVPRRLLAKPQSWVDGLSAEAVA